jgi:hypothetical protein
METSASAWCATRATPRSRGARDCRGARKIGAPNAAVRATSARDIGAMPIVRIDALRMTSTAFFRSRAVVRCVRERARGRSLRYASDDLREQFGRASSGRSDNQQRHDIMSYGAWIDICGYFDTKRKRVSSSRASLPPTSKCMPMTPFVLP